jgi:hypothetical protein
MHAGRLRRVARERGKEVQGCPTGAVVCRPTPREADEYFHSCAIEHHDDGAIAPMLTLSLSPAARQAMTRTEAQPWRAVAQAMADCWR